MNMEQNRSHTGHLDRWFTINGEAQYSADISCSTCVFFIYEKFTNLESLCMVVRKDSKHQRYVATHKAIINVEGIVVCVGSQAKVVNGSQ